MTGVSWREPGPDAGVEANATRGLARVRSVPPRPSPLRAAVAMAAFLLIGVALVFLTAFLLLPLLVVCAQALAKGLGTYLAAVSDPMALAAITWGSGPPRTIGHPLSTYGAYSSVQSTSPPRGPRSDLWVVEVTTSA